MNTVLYANICPPEGGPDGLLIRFRVSPVARDLIGTLMIFQSVKGTGLLRKTRR